MDRADIEELIAGNQAYLFAFLLRTCGDRDTAEDLMQETFVRAIRSADSYKPVAKVTTWLFQIAMNIVRDRWRRRVEVVALEDWMMSGGKAVEDEVLDRVEAGEVRRALMRLPLEQRSAVILAYYHDLSYSEIAQVQGCPLGTVKSRIHNGLVRLERLLAEEVTSDDKNRDTAGSR